MSKGLATLLGAGIGLVGCAIIGGVIGSNSGSGGLVRFAGILRAGE